MYKTRALRLTISPESGIMTSNHNRPIWLSSQLRILFIDIITLKPAQGRQNAYQIDTKYLIIVIMDIIYNIIS